MSSLPWNCYPSGTYETLLWLFQSHPKQDDRYFGKTRHIHTRFGPISYPALSHLPHSIAYFIDQVCFDLQLSDDLKDWNNELHPLHQWTFVFRVSNCMRTDFEYMP